jgi:hypothetical protein
VEQLAFPEVSSVAVRQFNDQCRKTFSACTILVAPIVEGLPDDEKATLIEAVRTFEQFNDEDDPHHEHQFDRIELFGKSWCWLFLYYDDMLRLCSKCPPAAKKTDRILLIMDMEES